MTTPRTEPPITIRAAHDSGRSNLVPTRYVIHATAGGRGYPRESAPGTARATAQYFTHASAGGSAHYIHDAGGDEEHCVPDDTIAWHAPPNELSLGDEICAEPSYTREQWLSPQVWPAVQAAARRCRDRCDHYGIPKVKLSPADLLAGKHGICGHVDVSQAWHQSTHWDPGPNFPWDRFMAEVLGQTPTPAPVEDDDMKLITSPGRGTALVGERYYRLLDKESIPIETAIHGSAIRLNDRGFDVAKRDHLFGDGALSAADVAAELKKLLPADGDGSSVDVDALAAKVVADLVARASA